MKVKRTKGFIHLFILIVIVIAVAGGIVYYAYKNGQIRLPASPQDKPEGQLKSTPSQNQSTPTSPTPTPDKTANWKTYNSDIMGISFKYPPDYDKPEEHDALPLEPDKGDFLSFISPLNPNRPKKNTSLLDGELKVEIFVEPSETSNSSLDCYKDHSGPDEQGITGSNIVDVLGKRMETVLWQGNGTGELLCLVNDNKRYIINKYPTQTSRQNEYLIFLSTFKFTK